MTTSDETPDGTTKPEIVQGPVFRTLQPADVEPELSGEAKFVQPVRMTKKGVGFDFDDSFDFRPQRVQSEGADPKGSAVPEPVPSSTSETTDGTSATPETSASAEKGSQTETEQPKKPEDSSPEPDSQKKTSAGKPKQPVEL